MRERCAHARRRTQRRVDQGQQRRRRPAFTPVRRKAQPDVLVLALLDEQLVQVARRQGLLEELLQFVFGHRPDGMLSPLPMSFLDHIARCNNADMSQFEPWFVGSERAGFIHRDFAPVLASKPDLFTYRRKAWHLDPALDTPAKRTAAMRAFLLELREQGRFKGLWREEAYPVTWEFTRAPLMAMERAAVPWFGVRAFGPHMTGYVRRRDGLHIWVPRRSYAKPTFPGELDNTVAGGQPVGIGLHDNLIKECAEEAAIPRAPWPSRPRPSASSPTGTSRARSSSPTS